MRTSKIQKGCQGGPKWIMGSGKGSTPRVWALLFVKYVFWSEHSFYEKRRRRRKEKKREKRIMALIGAPNVVASWLPKRWPTGTPHACAKSSFSKTDRYLGRGWSQGKTCMQTLCLKRGHISTTTPVGNRVKFHFKSYKSSVHSISNHG